MTGADTATTQLAVGTLGGLRLLVGDERVTLGARSAEALLVYVVHRGNGLSRGALAELLWPDADGARGKVALRAAIRRIRRVASQALEATRSTVAAGLGVETDAQRFERLVRDDRLEQALDLFRGDFLAGFAYPRSQAFEAWQAEEAARYRTMALALHQELLARAMAGGDEAAAIARATALLGLEPWHESAHRTLLRLLARAGRRGEALRRHHAFVAELAAELGTEPDPETARLAEAIAAGTVVDAPERAAVVPNRDGEDDRSLRHPGPFVGRVDALAIADRRLADPDCRWLTVVGPGGVGKTRLAAEVARRARARFPDGVRFVHAAAARGPDALRARIAADLGLPEIGPRDAEAHISAYLASRRLLLVVDELDEDRPGALAVARILHRAPAVVVLATSRTRLHLGEEWLLPLDGLDLAADAPALFNHHAARADPGFDPLAEAEAVRSICASVDGLPLALELAASWMNALRCSDVASAVAHGATPAAPRSDLPPRHRSIALVFDGSWDVLPDDLRSVYPRLACFQGSFALAQAERVASAGIPELTALVDRSLLRSRRDGRFELHALTRRDAAARLTARGEHDQVARRHLHAYRDLAGSVAPAVLGPGFHEALETFALERDNVAAALAWGMARPSEHDAAGRLLDATALAWRAGSAVREARTWLDRGLAMTSLSSPLRAALLGHAALFAWMQGVPLEAAAFATRSLDLWDERSDDGAAGAARVRTTLAMAQAVAGQHDAAARSLDHAVMVLEAHDLPWWSALAVGWRGNVAVARGDFPRARHDLDRAMASFRALGSVWGIALFGAPIVELRLAEGDLAGAVALADETMSLLQELGFDLGLAAACELRAHLARLEGNEANAASLERRAEAIYHELGVAPPDASDRSLNVHQERGSAAITW